MGLLTTDRRPQTIERWTSFSWDLLTIPKNVSAFPPKNSLVSVFGNIIFPQFFTLMEQPSLQLPSNSPLHTHDGNAASTQGAGLGFESSWGFNVLPKDTLTSGHKKLGSNHQLCDWLMTHCFS